MKQINTDPKDIIIKQVLMNNGEPRFVEYYSHADSRNSIINADRFCEIFGYTLEDLKNQQT